MYKLRCYRVQDLVLNQDELRAVFLLESPHTNEVLHGHPLAGNSGRSVTKWLTGHMEEFRGWDPKVPFGCQIREKGYQKIGLMNCSLFPMNKSVYDCSFDPNCAEWIAGMDPIRGGKKTEKTARIKKSIVQDLTRRLINLPRSVLIVPCGKVARTMTERVKKKTKTITNPTISLKIYPDKVPHPSNNNWNKADNSQTMNSLAEALCKIL